MMLFCAGRRSQKVEKEEKRPREGENSHGGRPMHGLNKRVAQKVITSVFNPYQFSK